MQTIFMIVTLIMLLVTMWTSLSNSSTIRGNYNSRSHVLSDINKDINNVSKSILIEFTPFFTNLNQHITNSINNTIVRIVSEFSSLHKSIDNKYELLFDKLKLIHDNIEKVEKNTVAINQNIENHIKANIDTFYMTETQLHSIETVSKNSYTDLAGRLTTIEQQNIKILEVLSKTNAKIPTTRNRSTKD